MPVQNTKYAIEVAVLARVNADGDQVRRPGEGGHVWFGEADRALRGRLEPSAFSTLDPSEELKILLMRVGSIPGEVIWTDLKSNEWGVFDPLNNPKPDSVNSRKVARLKEAMQKRMNSNSDLVFKQPLTKKLHNDDDRKNILYWMRRLINAKQAVYVDGSPELPSLDDIKAMPGRRKVGYGEQPSDEVTRESLARHDYYVAASSK